MADIIVVGAGHAGIEAALSCARLNMKTMLITSRFGNAALLPCNTAIGGPAKGIVVREIDALGGEMGKAADACALQMKMLNTAKGPGVWSLRAQVDKMAYPRYMQNVLKNTANLEITEGTVEDLRVDNNKVTGVILEDGTRIPAQAVILTTGTYLRSRILIGPQAQDGGPNLEKYSRYLSTKLKEQYGFRLLRLKTGTPPRVAIDSVDFTKTVREDGSKEPYSFSYETTKFLKQQDMQPCYLTYTNEKTHQIIRDNLALCSMYSGLVEGVGPRYCPSIETKVVRFKDKDRHQIFLEPESLEMDTIYVQGFSNSMPPDIQEQMTRTIPGLENCRIVKYAYAIEYDAIDPLQLYPSLETKKITNLFTAGQINGTSGYEEAAGQGVIAGINAVRKLRNEPPLILKRDEAYIGVMIDDLVTKGTAEPYRLLTSRAEYRLLLRHDNADERLSRYGYETGLISKERYERLLEKQNRINNEIKKLEQWRLPVDHPISEKLSTPVKAGNTAADLLKRPGVTYETLRPYIPDPLEDNTLSAAVDIHIKYAGYIEKTKRRIASMEAMENKKIPPDFDYEAIASLSLESRQKLSEIRPLTVGQASRISGVSPADISVLLVILKQQGY